MKFPDPKLRYKCYSQDTTEYLDLLMSNGLMESGIVKKTGLNPYQIAKRPIFDAYAKKNLWSMIAKDYLIYSHDYDDDLRISQGLVDQGNFTQLKQLWRTYLITVRSWYWRRRGELRGAILELGAEGSNQEWDEVKNTAITAFMTYRHFVDELSYEREIAWIEEEVKLFQNEEKRKPRLKKPLADKIDDVKFWMIIERARSHSDGVAELFSEHIANQLQDFKSIEIKRFQNTLYDKVETLNHWSLWALAYISQHGCSEDSFLYFRAWLISLGQEVYNQAIVDIHGLLSQVNSNGIVENEGLLYAAFEAYDIRTEGKEMDLRERKEIPPKGQEWTESDVQSKYPEIWNYYR